MVETVEVKPMILVTGADGQLGQALEKSARRSNVQSIGLSRLNCDITDKKQVYDTLQKIKPSLVINCAAWTNVDQAEVHPGQATEINAYGAQNLAFACRSISATFFQISTDYVFSGETFGVWAEDDIKSPCSVYGASKSLGEDLVLETYPEKSYVIRTAWLYSFSGSNFLRTILNRINSNRLELRVVSDQIGQPTSATDVAERIIQMSKKNLNSQIFHATNSGEATWFDFACEIYRLKGLSTSLITPITSNELDQIAKRPTSSVLGHSAWINSGMNPMRNWRDALASTIMNFDRVEGV